MSKTAAYVRYAVVPSFPRLPLEHPGLSIANRRPFSRDFFNSIGRFATVAERPILLQNSVSEGAEKIPGPPGLRFISDVGGHAISCCAPPRSFSSTFRRFIRRIGDCDLGWQEIAMPAFSS